MRVLLHIAEHSFSDSLKVLPFLFIAFLVMEFCEKHSEGRLTKLLEKKNACSTVIGSLLGIIPQCGFSVTAAGLFSGGLISIGTLIAIFLSTSDEAFILLLTNGRHKAVIALIIAKLIIAISGGILTDFLLKNKHNRKDVHNLCTGCGCERSSGIVIPALKHTVKIFLFVLLCSFVLDGAIELIGEESFNKFMLSGNLLQPVVASLIGLIPNCASSVMLTELYISGTLSFGALLSGLSVNSGVALIVLFKQNRPHKENCLIILLTFIISVTTGIILGLFI